MVAPNRAGWIVACLVAALGGPRQNATAQILGNPASNLVCNEWSVGISGEVLHRDIDGTNYQSYRGIGKVGYGVTDWLTVHGLLGVANLRINNPDGSALAGIGAVPGYAASDFNGDPQFAFGGGLKLDAYRHYQWVGFVSGGMWRVRSESTVRRQLGTEIEQRHFTFDWREYWGAGGVLLERDRADFYGGVEARAIQRLPRVSGVAFRTALRPGIFTGLDVHLGEGYVMNFQVKLITETTVSVGLGSRTLGRAHP